MGIQPNAVCVVLACVTVVFIHSVGSQTEPKIRHARAIGGQPISRGSQPWLVLLKATIVTRRFLGIPIGHRHVFCGGSVLNDYWILSAAHCFKDYGREARLASNWEVRLASVHLRATPTERILHFLGRLFDMRDWLQWEIDVERIVVHPAYNRSSIWANDIALVKLKRKVPSGPTFSYIRKLHLPLMNETDFPLVHQECQMSGWGCTVNGGGASRVARLITMPVYSSSRCRRHYHVKMENRICAGYRNRGVGVCAGDSGSSLVCHENGRDLVAGVVSFTSRDRPGSYPAVFTKVTPYVSWINDIISNGQRSQ
ncbi:trypsin I-P1-like [Gigantopelta aegis]|uniref:trypsin I-P1-like n=1 Tax=Gigantopelta aegis TaxID=1735272 RepID=UPI001B88DF55|nr:trypsin I-P1-like [Gigantopelta aegis]